MASHRIALKWDGTFASGRDGLGHSWSGGKRSLLAGWNERAIRWADWIFNDVYIFHTAILFPEMHRTSMPSVVYNLHSGLISVFDH